MSHQKAKCNGQIDECSSKAPHYLHLHLSQRNWMQALVYYVGY